MEIPNHVADPLPGEAGICRWCQMPWNNAIHRPPIDNKTQEEK